MSTGGTSTVRHVVLDRDGVLNRELRGAWTTAIADWEWESGAVEGLALLDAEGIAVSIVTNQSCISRGLVRAGAVRSLHRWLARELAVLGIHLHGIYVCPHAPDVGCRCRKPSPALVLQAVRSSGVHRRRTVLVGDSTTDAAAARAAGVRAVGVATGKGQLDGFGERYTTLHEAAAAITSTAPVGRTS